MARQDIVELAERYPDMTVYSPPPERAEVTAETLRRKLTERVHGIIKNRGMSRFLVHGREKVRAVCLLQAMALNSCWANTLRRRIGAAAPAMPAIA